jgi:hypothetical protein
VQTSDVAQVGAAQEPVHLRRLVVSFAQDDRPIRSRAEAGVDACARGEHAHPDIAICSQSRPARFRDLDEDASSSEIGTVLQESFDCEKLVDDALGVVETIDADPKADTRL